MRINTLPLQHLHRDMLNRVIRLHDYVVWSNGKYKQTMELCKVLNSTSQKVNIQVVGSEKTTVVFPHNLMVVTHQVERNFEGNVGANMDLEATR